MKPWLRYAICILLGMGGGTAYAVHQVRSGFDDKQVRNEQFEQWSANIDQGTVSASALTRAKVALNGLLALPAKEAMYFVTRTDMDGAPLNGKCTYFVIGPKLPGRWWSITLYRDEGWLVKNPANRWSIAGHTLQTNPPERGTWMFVVSPHEHQGNWLPTGGVDRFDLTLRIYHPSVELLRKPGGAELPFVRKEHCK